MRAFITFVAGMLALALVICGVIFVVENAATRSYSFLGATISLPLWAVVGLAALAGFLVALLVVTPARVAAEARYSQLRALARRQERDLADTRAANERLQSQLTTLQAEHTVATRERDAYRDRLDSLRAAPERTEATMRTDRAEPAPAEPVPAAVQAAPTSGDVVVGRRETEMAAPGQAETAREAEREGTEAPVAQGGLGDRLRTLFGRPSTPDEDQTPQGPAAPA